MLRRFQVFGRSMFPSLHDGDEILTERISYLFRSPKVGEIVVVRDGDMNKIKRVTRSESGRVYLRGDNQAHSRELGPFTKREILGRAII